MRDYQLNEKEVVILRSDILLLQTQKKGKTKTELLLTNENFVIINRIKRLLQKEEIETVVVPIESIKIYNEMPYMIKKEKVVEIYTTKGEYFLEFENKKEAKEFFNKSMRIASGFSKFVRGVKKINKEIKETNEALDIDIVDTAKKTVYFAADVVADYSTQPLKGKIQLIGSVAKAITKRKGKEQLQIDGNIDKKPTLSQKINEEAEE